MTKQRLFLASIAAAFAITLALAIALAVKYRSAVLDLEKMRADRNAVSDVERFIERARPTLDPATRRGMAEFMVEASAEQRIPYRVMVSVGEAESSFIPSALGDGGKSHGIYQVQGFWVKEIPFIKKVRDLHRTDLGIRAGAWVLRHYADKCGEEPALYLACYNSGPNINEQSRKYAKRVMSET